MYPTLLLVTLTILDLDFSYLIWTWAWSPALGVDAVLALALTLLRAWACSGCPRMSFNPWWWGDLFWVGMRKEQCVLRPWRQICLEVRSRAPIDCGALWGFLAGGEQQVLPGGSWSQMRFVGLGSWEAAVHSCFSTSFIRHCLLHRITVSPFYTKSWSFSPGYNQGTGEGGRRLKLPWGMLLCGQLTLFFHWLFSHLYHIGS